jgi:protease I
VKLFLALLFFSVSLSAAPAKKILMMVPDDFMWPEYSEPKKLYEKAGFKVTIAAKVKEKIKPDRRNKKDYPESGEISPDLNFDEVKVEDFDAITFVAGNGAWHDFFPSQTVHNIVMDAFKKNKVVGLLCASTGLLGLVGNWDGQSKPLAEGKEVVGYFRVEGILKNLGKVKFVAGGPRDPAVAVDGNLVTGRNPESSKIFGEKIVEVLSEKK